MSTLLQCSLLLDLWQGTETAVNLKRSVTLNFIQLLSHKQKDSLTAKIYQIS